MNHNTKALREKRANIIEQMKDSVRLATEEARSFTDEERQAFDGWEGEESNLTKDIERMEKANAFADDAAEKLAEKAEVTGVSKDELTEKEAYSRAFNNYILKGDRGLTNDEAQLLRKGDSFGENRAQSIGTTTEGGYLSPEGFSNELEVALLEFGGMREAARIIKTATGGVLPWPENDDTGNSGSILAENTADGETDLVFGESQLDAYMYTSDIIKVSRQLMQDSYFDINALIKQSFANRLGRATNAHYTTGTGSGQPNGVVTASTAGKTTASATAFTYNEVLDLKHSVGRAYRKGKKSGFMFSDATMKAIKQLSVGSSDARPLWQVSPIVGEPSTVDGDRYWVNDDMADSGTASYKFMLYGDFSKYIIRDVLGFEFLRLNERYADSLQVGYIGFMRTDGELVDAGTNPIKHMIHASS